MFLITASVFSEFWTKADSSIPDVYWNIFSILSRMSITNRSSDRLDINQILLNNIPITRFDAIRRYHIGRHSDFSLDVICKSDKGQSANRFIKFHEDIHITLFRLIAPGIGSEQCK